MMVMTSHSTGDRKLTTLPERVTNGSQHWRTESVSLNKLFKYRYVCTQTDQF